MAKWVLWSVARDYRDSYCAICHKKTSPYISFNWDMDNPLNKGDSLGSVSIEVCEEHAHLIDRNWKSKVE